ncbi:MAG: hypothetical protein MK081_14705 [Flavobacteriales bacterium]|nr:hypothetical protein [Flavobacteriales bacterium]
MRHLSLIFFIAIGISVFGSTETSLVYQYGSDLYPSSAVYSVEDGKYLLMSEDAGWNDDFHNEWVEARFELGVDLEYEGPMVDEYGLTLTMDITQIDLDGSVLSTSTGVTLHVDYRRILGGGGTSTPQTVEIHREQGAFRYEYTITGMSMTDALGNAVSVDANSVPSNLYLRSSVVVDRYYSFDHLGVPTELSHRFLDASGNETSTMSLATEVEFYWNFIEGAEEYHLEWTYVDDYGTGTDFSSSLTGAEIGFTDRDFELNSTRIMTTDQHYRVPLLFDRGYIIYRLRGIGRSWGAVEDPYFYVYGSWSSDQSPSIVWVNDWPHQFPVSSFEGSKNWQSVTSFAEGGLKKEVVTYADGSSRSRQVLSRINSLDSVIVGETIYDFHGRGVIQTLPVPSGDDLMSLHFREQFNRNTNGEDYSAMDFDQDLGLGLDPCVDVPTGGFHSGYGAGMYYSSKTSLDEHDASAYIPVAGGYPFTQVEYMADATGRVRRQSGVGVDHTLGSSHETKYFYGKADQEELDRLFGVEAGYASRYKKNMVVDPNGQVSVTYIDAHGRTVATALAGNTPAQLTALGSSGTTNTLVVDMLNKTLIDDVDDVYDENHLSDDENSLVHSSQYNSPQSGTMELFYQVTRVPFSPTCGPAVDVEYVLDLSVNTFCSDNLVTPITSSQVDLSVNNQYSWLSTPLPIDVGTYQIHKELSIDEDALSMALANYADLISTDSTCFFTQHDYYVTVDAGGEVDCDPVCENCDPPTLCELYYELLRSDMIIGGQYAGLPGTADYDVLSVFHPNSHLNGGSAAYQSTSLSYKSLNENDGILYVSFIPVEYDDLSTTPPSNLDDQTPVVLSSDPSTYTVVDPSWYNQVLEYDGEYYVLPNSLSEAQDFIDRYELTWADELVKFHPEFCELAPCGYLPGTTNVFDTAPTGFTYSSHDFDLYMQELIGYSYGASTLADITSNLSANAYAVMGDGANGNPDDGLLESLAEYTFGNDLMLEMMLYDPFWSNEWPNGNTELLNLFNYISDQAGSELMNYQGSGSDALYFACTVNDNGNWFGNNAPLVSYDETPFEIASFASYYLSIKQQAQQLLFAFEGVDNGCYIPCIDFNADNYVQYAQPIVVYDFVSDGTPESGAYWDVFTTECLGVFDEYQSRTRRILLPDNFPSTGATSTNEMLASGNDGLYQLYQETGTCPKDIVLEQFISDLFTSGAAGTTAATPILNLESFTLDLYLEAIHSGTVPAALSNLSVDNYEQFGYVDYDLLITGQTGSVLTVDLDVTNNTLDRLAALEFTATNLNSPTDWQEIADNVVSVSGFYCSGAGTSFSFLIGYNDIEDGYTEVVVTGTGLFQVCDCGGFTNSLGDGTFTSNSDSPFNFGCEPLASAEGIATLTSELILNGDLSSTITLSTTSYPGVYGSDALADFFGNPVSYSWDGTTDELTAGFNSMDLSIQTNYNGSYYELMVDEVYIYNGESYYDGMIGGVITPSIGDIIVRMQALPTTIDPLQSFSSQLTEFYAAVTVDDLTSVAAIEMEQYSLCTPPGWVDCPEDQITLTLQALGEGVSEAEAGGYFATGALNQPISSPYNGLEVLLNNNLVSPDEIDWSVDAMSNQRITFDVFVNGFNECKGEVEVIEGASSYTVIEDLAIGSVAENAIVTPISVNEDGPYSVFTVEFYDALNRPVVIRVQAPCFGMGDCGGCDPVVLAPISCTDSYDTYDSGMLGFTGYAPVVESSLVDPPSTTAEEDALINAHYFASQEDICSQGLAYYVADYLNYLSFYSITSTDDPRFLSLQGYAGINFQLYELDYVGGYSDPLDASFLVPVDFVSMLYASETPPDVCPPTIPYTPIELPLTDDPCEENAAVTITSNAEILYNEYVDGLLAAFEEQYRSHAMSTVVEKFIRISPDTEHHHTLYYYDQAGNLVKTVPPEGVVINSDPAFLDGVASARANENYVYAGNDVPDHHMETRYRYNTLNQLVWQKTPDGGQSFFYYDELGRLVASQNAEQATSSRYSYTIYDDLGRIAEAGELNNGSGISSIITAPYEHQVSYQEGQNNFIDWTVASTKEEVVKTQYDEPLAGISANFNEGQLNLRNRVASTYYDKNNDGQYEHASHYSYDIHGNVDEYIQEIADLAFLEQDMKKIEYTYDLISGNVLQVDYQSGEVDGYHHRYEYDSDNRITQVETSHDQVTWDRDAKYFYYAHGPLSRTEIGHDKIQGCDHAYTVQGWLKGLNSLTLERTADMGVDAEAAGSNLHHYVAEDEYGYLLGYFGNDYTARGSQAENFTASLDANAGLTANDLYNGNIKHMATAIQAFMQGSNGPQLMEYQYDQLNRLGEARSQSSVINAGQLNLTASQAYKVNLTYDANGNITTLKRNGAGGQLMDDLVYTYNTGGGFVENNRLVSVSDQELNMNALEVTDFENASYYEYDEIGNLVREIVNGNGDNVLDGNEGERTIEWLVTGKIAEIKHNGTMDSGGNYAPNLAFEYDAMGNRVVKQVRTRDANGVLQAENYWTTSYYVRDPQGNVMAIYQRDPQSTAHAATPGYSNIEELKVSEHHLYGSSRLGSDNKPATTAYISYNYVGGGYTYESTPTSITAQTFGISERVQGDKRYELSNHLGNVLVVVTDMKYSLDTDSDGDADYYISEVSSANDYYPFGMLMPGRHEALNQLENHRYGFSTKENDNELKGTGNSIDFGARMYDSRIGRWLSADPKEHWYPAYSPYSYAANSPNTIVDNEGEFLGTIIGAAVGAVVGGVSAAIKGENVWAGAGQGAISGAVAGAIFDVTVATAGTGTVAIIAAGALSGAGGNIVDQGFDLLSGKKEHFSGSELAVSTVLGGGLGYLGGKLSPFIRNIFKRSNVSAGPFLPQGSPLPPRTFTGADDLVTKTANQLESAFPNSVKGVEQLVTSGRNALTDFDIVLDDIVIEVTKGGGKGKMNQIVNRLIPNTSKEVVLFAPKVKGSVERKLTEAGVKVFKDSEKLIEYVGQTVASKNTGGAVGSTLNTAAEQATNE